MRRLVLQPFLPGSPETDNGHEVSNKPCMAGRASNCFAPAGCPCEPAKLHREPGRTLNRETGTVYVFRALTKIIWGSVGAVWIPRAARSWSWLSVGPAKCTLLRHRNYSLSRTKSKTLHECGDLSDLISLSASPQLRLYIKDNPGSHPLPWVQSR
jgi:hypothetical protein